MLTKATGYRPIRTGLDMAQTLAGLAGVTLTNKGIAEASAAKSGTTSANTAKTNTTARKNYLSRVLAAQRSGQHGWTPVRLSRTLCLGSG